MIGKIYKHRLTGEKLTVKKIVGNIAVCKTEFPKFINQTFFIDDAICKIENLIKLNQKPTQQKLF